MSSNTRFAVAVHILTLLAQSHDDQAPATSEVIASSVNTNPVVIRRVLGALRRERLVTSQGGNGGGWRLADDPSAITLRDVYRAVAGEPLLQLHHRPPIPACAVGRHFQPALAGRFAAASYAVEADLARTSVEQ
ncbi:MAG: Rrf2 family transcriptional regulator, partial [Ktedonobacterales bacterium]